MVNYYQTSLIPGLKQVLAGITTDRKHSIPVSHSIDGIMPTGLNSHIFLPDSGLLVLVIVLGREVVYFFAREGEELIIFNQFN